jgi:ribosome biogenesis protein NSA1
LTLVDVNNQKTIFQAKNVRHNTLDLRVPVWIRDIRFFLDSSKLITGTGHHQIRVYDIRTQRRPVLDYTVGEHPINVILPVPSQGTVGPANPKTVSFDYTVLCADTVGNIVQTDLRKVGHVVGKYRGPTGSIRGLDVHGEGPGALLASCGLDRYLYMHQLDTKKLVTKFYLKQRLGAVAFLDEGKAAEEEEDEEDEVWDELEKVGDAEEEEGREGAEREHSVKRKRTEDNTKSSAKKRK